MTTIAEICEGASDSLKSFLAVLQDVERVLQEEHAVKFVKEDIEDTEILTEDTDEEKSATVEEAAGETAVTIVEATTVLPKDNAGETAATYRESCRYREFATSLTEAWGAWFNNILIDDRRVY